MSELKDKLTNDMKDAMRQKEKQRLATIRLALAAIKQREVDERIELSNEDVLATLEKMIKQRRESLKIYSENDRKDLADQEQIELDVLVTYLPEPLSEDDLQNIIQEAIKQTGAASMKDMGQVMGVIKPQVQGRADMGQLSQKIKALLS